jgi:hypothetical protein
MVPWLLNKFGLTTINESESKIVKSKEQKEASKAKQTKYESSANRKQVLIIRTSKTDKVEEWDSIVTWLKSEGDGSAKDGLYQLAKKNGII